ncbi:MAG TPA: hypothetical protein VLM91_13860, partial [Candidatus Methylomirabilis sp.]|nr:hypothetical protein [Candidatus Methylomirabilis sp.]
MISKIRAGDSAWILWGCFKRNGDRSFEQLWVSCLKKKSTWILGSVAHVAVGDSDTGETTTIRKGKAAGSRVDEAPP